MLVRRALPVLALALSARTGGGCAGDGGKGSFTLTLSPRFLEGQDILGEDPDVELVVQRPGAEPELHYVGQASAGASLSIPEIDPVGVGAIVGLLAETTGGTEGRWDPSRTLAYGQVTVEVDPGAEAAIDVLVPQFAQIGELGRVPEGKRRMSAAAALLPNGDVYVFGGTEASAVGFGDGSDRIFALRDTDGGGSAFEDVELRIPEATEIGAYGEETFGARCAATATPVTVDGKPMIFVAGGRPRWWDAVANTKQWFLFDPEDDSIADEGNLGTPHSGHLAIPLRGGKILIYGGIVSNGFPQSPSFDLWNPETKTNKAGETLYQSSGVLAFGTTLGDDAVVCGGLTATVTPVTATTSIFDWTPLATCARISANGDVDTFEPLPVPLAGATMAELPDGDLLVTGGVAEVLTDSSVVPQTFESAPARTEMYRYRDGVGWAEVGRLLNARAQHRMLALADGRVLVVGGTIEATALFGALTEPVRCPELYDPADDSVREMDCTDAGSGAFPVVGSLPGEGAFVLEGYTVDSNLVVDGMAAFGVVSTGPPLQ